MRKAISATISCDRKVFGVIMSPSNERKIWSPKEKCQILNTAGTAGFESPENVTD